MQTLTSIGFGLVFIDVTKFNDIVFAIDSQATLSYEQFNSLEFKCVDDAMFIETGYHLDINLIAHLPMPEI